MRQSVQAVASQAATVLLSRPTHEGDAGDACAALLTGGEGADQGVLWVTYTRSPDACVRALDNRAQAPVNGVVLVVGERRTGGPPVPDAVTVESLERPGDLTGLGIAVRRHLETPSDAPRAVCFDSLTSLLQYVDLATAYEFLHVLCGQTRAADATAHFHLDPNAHDDRTVSTLTSLFDVAIDVREDGAAVRSRFEE